MREITDYDVIGKCADSQKPKDLFFKNVKVTLCVQLSVWDQKGLFPKGRL